MEHFYEKIPGFFDFQDVYLEAVKNAKDGARFAEVGVWKGRSAAFLGTEIENSGKRIELALVDLWDTAPPCDGIPEAASLSECMRNLQPLENGKFVKPKFVSCDSVEAAALFEDGSFDFVFLDGNHDYERVRNDIHAWLPKVKAGGTLAGHDYQADWPGVVWAVYQRFGRRIERSGSSWILRVT